MITIDKLKTDIALDELLVKCDIPGIGPETARKIAIRVRNAVTLRDLIEENKLKEAFQEVSGISEKSINSLIDCLTNVDFLLLLEDMEDNNFDIFSKDYNILSIEELDTVPITVPIQGEIIYDSFGDNLDGLVVSIAGTLSLPRRMFQEMISKKGGKFSTNIDEKVDIVVYSDIDGTKSARYKIAEKLNKKGAGINLISEKTFVDKFSKKVK